MSDNNKEQIRFTAADVELLREALVFEDHEPIADEEKAERLENLARRIEALLPPDNN